MPTTAVGKHYDRRSVPNDPVALSDWLTKEFGSVQQAMARVPNLAYDIKADFGAIGRGLADDTAAFQRADSKAHRQWRSVQVSSCSQRCAMALRQVAVCCRPSREK